MKKNIQIIMITSIGLSLLSACGGGKSRTPIDTTTIKVEKCNSSILTILKKDDNVTALTDDTQVRITHTQDGEKVACLLSGEAKIN